ncbi:MAG: MFS transporter, partial [Promethearchaeota archaeon]
FCATLDATNIDADCISEEIEIEKTINNNVKPLNKGFYIGFIALILALLATSITGTIYSTFVSAYLIESHLLVFPTNIIPIIVMIVYFPAQVLSQLVASKIGNSFDRISPLLSLIVIGIFKSLMIWILILTISPIDFAIVLIFLYIAAESNSYLIQAIMSRLSIKHRGKVFGLTMWIDRLGRTIGPLIGGILWATQDFNLPFIISVYMGLCLIPLFMFAIRKLSPYMVEQVEIDKIGILNINK